MAPNQRRPPGRHGDGLRSDPQTPSLGPAGLLPGFETRPQSHLLTFTKRSILFQCQVPARSHLPRSWIVTRHVWLQQLGGVDFIFCSRVVYVGSKLQCVCVCVRVHVI